MVLTQSAVDLMGFGDSGQRFIMVMTVIRDRARRLFPWLDSHRTAPGLTQSHGGTSAPLSPAPTQINIAPIVVESPLENRAISTPLSAQERRARAAVVRGLMHARQCRFLLAHEAFAEGLAMDPALDLVAVPTFWQMPRGGQEAAVRAYETVGRIRDAATLAATIRRTFTPRALPVRPHMRGAAPANGQN